MIFHLSQPFYVKRDISHCGIINSVLSVIRRIQND